METDEETERLRNRIKQENLLRRIRAASLDMQGQLKERSRLCRDRCARLDQVHLRIEEEIVSGQRGLFDAETLVDPALLRLIDTPSIE